MKAKVRQIRGGENPVYGIPIPRDLVPLVINTTYLIEIHTGSIILKSGCDIEFLKTQVKDYKFEDVRI